MVRKIIYKIYKKVLQNNLKQYIIQSLGRMTSVYIFLLSSAGATRLAKLSGNVLQPKRKQTPVCAGSTGHGLPNGYLANNWFLKYLSNFKNKQQFNIPPQLSRQSARLLIDRSLVRVQQGEPKEKQVELTTCFLFLRHLLIGAT